MLVRDFTLNAFLLLLCTLKEQGYDFITFFDYCHKSSGGRFIIFRHDVDTCPESALRIALLESKKGIRAAYYFRTGNRYLKKTIIKQIAEMGHEIGYHYENLSTSRGNFELAITSFENDLEALRQLADVRTICMHGSPLTKWDNRLLWQRFNYRDYGIIGEPYFDTDFDKVLYLTDTGRRWNSKSSNVRDKVDSKFHHNMRTTADIISALQSNALPDQIMINVHPHRWNDDFLPWLKELLWQNTKNVGKRLLLKRRFNLHSQ